MKNVTRWMLGTGVAALVTLGAVAFAADTCTLGEVVGVKQVTKGKANVLAVSGEDFGSGSKDVELPADALDGDLNTKYFNQAVDGSETPGINSGLAVTLKSGPTAVTGIQLATANDMEKRDPAKIVVEGSNDPKALEAGCAAFTLVYEGEAGLKDDPGRNAWGKEVKFDNKIAYKTYRIIVTETRIKDADAVQYSEVKFISGTDAKKDEKKDEKK
ncbi:TPA: hypothetical protein DDW35_12605 [Candidatus Sumerlaeota bacterium]|jgi:hypothetical protein|nr:hypothetical protein [Candidatus Sumerlaeota bacterium]